MNKAASLMHRIGMGPESRTKLKQRVRNAAFWLALLRWLLPLVLVVVLAGLLADTVWLWVSGPNDPVPRDPDLTRLEGRSDSGEEKGLEYDQVRDWALFGTWKDQDDDEDDEDSETVDAPETRLELTLLGVFQTGGETERAGAIIAEEGGNGELYRVGDRLPGEARLEEVHADRVILRRQGQLEALKLESPSLAGDVKPADDSAAEDDSESRPSRERSDEDESGEDKGRLSGDVEEQRDRIMRGLDLESTDEGYVIGDDAPAELLDRAGLKSGDVVVSVNGEKVGDKETDLEILKSYHDEGNAEVVIQRDAQKFTIKVPP